MKNLLLLIVFAWATAHAQEQIRQDSVLIGKPSTANDKVLSFDTADGASNPKLSVEKVSKKLKYDQNTFQLGGASATDNKDFIFNGDNKKIRYDGTANELQYDGDLLSVGDGTNTSKTFKFNKGASSPYFKYDSVSGKLVFSNDGTLEKKFGTGSGGSGGINILENADFEDGVTAGWTNSGGTFTSQDYANPSENNLKFARFVASGAGQYIESDLTVVPTFLGAGCQAQFEKYATVTDGAWKIVVLDASSNVLATQNFNQSGGATTFISTPLLSFPCPASPATFKVRLESLAAATIDFDLAYGGGNKNVITNTVVDTTWTACTFPSMSWTGLGTVTGQLYCRRQGPSLKMRGRFIPGTLTASVVAMPLPLWNGVALTTSSAITAADSGGHILRAQSTANHYQNVILDPSSTTVGFSQATVSFASDPTVKATGSGGFVTAVSYIVNGELTIPIQGWETISPSDAVTSEQSGWFIDANIGGANPSLGTSSVSSYSEITNAGLDMVLSSGSASAEIPCSTTNSSTGLTCSAGSEGLGVVFTPPSAGFYEVCANFSHYTVTSTSGSVLATFQLIETTSGTQTIIQEGGVRSQSVNNNNGLVLGYPHSICGKFYFSSATKKTIRLMYEQSAGGTITQNILYADRNASYGQVDTRFIVRPLLSPFNRPVLTGDQVTTPGAIKPVFYSALVSNTGAVSNEVGDFISGNCTNANPFVCTFNSGFFGSGSPVNCGADSADSSTANERSQVVSASTDAGATIYTTAANALSQRAFRLFCHGTK